MQHATLPAQPTADDLRALARSSPWRFRTLHWTTRSTDLEGRESTAEAWLRRPGHLTVRDDRGVHVEVGAPYGTSVRLAWPVTSGRSDPPSPPAPTPVPAPRLRADGLVLDRPAAYHLEHGDPMWQSSLWPAMRDPEELSNQVDRRYVHAADRMGRGTW